MLTEKQTDYHSLIQRINHYIHLLDKESQEVEHILSRSQLPKQTKWSPFYQEIYELSMDINRFKEVRHRLEDILAK